MNATERAMLEQYLEWLLTRVIPGYERRHDGESVRQAQQQVDDIRWRLETGKPAPMCGWKKPYREHPDDCGYCTMHARRLAKLSHGLVDQETTQG